MAIEDRIKWDKRYQETPSLVKERNPSKKLHKVIEKVKGNKALEIACGTGRNSLFLAENGFEVEALDISSVALSYLDSLKLPNIQTKCLDLEGYRPAEDSYDLIVKTNYLDRDIIPHLAKALKKDGILLIETYMESECNTKPSSNPNFFLKGNELKTFFEDDYEILEYDEFENESFERFRMIKQSIIVKKR